MSTPGNWLNDAVPQNGSEIVFQSASGEIVNDLDSFSPKSITFGAGVSAGIKISGNPITGLYAVTNLTASVKPEIAASVTFAEGVEADFLCASSSTNYLKFTGGMTIYTFKKRGASGDSGDIHIAGLITITKNHSDWGGYKEIDHFFIHESGSVLTIPNSVAQETSPANFSIDAGTTVRITGDLVSKTEGFAYWNQGMLDVSGWVVKDRTDGNVHFSQEASSGYIKAYGIKEATGDQGGDFVLTSTANINYPPHWVLGAGGIGAGMYITHDAKSGGGELKIHIYAADDFTINGSIKLGQRAESTSRRPMLHIYTEDVDGTNPRTVILARSFTNGNNPYACMRIYGNGTFIDQVGELLPAGVEVNTPAKYYLLPDRKSGNRFIFQTGCTLKVPSSGTATVEASGKLNNRDNIVEIQNNTTLAFNFTDASTAPCLAFSGTHTIGSGITVSVTTDVSLPFNTSWTLTSGANTDLSKFTLDEETAKWATLSVSGGNLVLTRKPFFHIKIADSEAVDIPWNWVEDKVGALGTEGVNFTSAVLADGANGIPVWQSYCLGLDPQDAASTLLCEAAAEQPADGKIRIAAKNLNVPADLSGVAVTAYLDRKNGDGWDLGVASAPVSSGSAVFEPEIGDGTSFFA